MERDIIKDVLFGVAVGDALGVPAEIKTRVYLRENPVTDMKGYGSHNKPAGTWSDDSSLTFCLAEMLCGGYDTQDLAQRLVDWKNKAYWTPNGEMFGIGSTTAAAIDRIEMGMSPVLAGGDGQDSNGNGSLMRILPLLFLVKDRPIDSRFHAVREISSLTHRHIRAVVACFIYIEVALEILSGKDKKDAYQQACITVDNFLDRTATVNDEDRAAFSRMLTGLIQTTDEEDILSGGYVIHTLEASLWSFLNTSTYAEAVLKATNLGGDSDTTAAVTGGLAGLFYGWQTIPEEWLRKLARKEDIEDLGRRLGKKLG